jgi:hypothetical protein
MVQIIDILAQYNIILVAVMLSGIIVKMGHARGTIRGDTHFQKFYALFGAFILENIVITLLANFLFLPLFQTILMEDYWKAGAITVEMTLLSNLWFSWTFGFKYRLEIIVLAILGFLVLAYLFVSSPPWILQ